jgi:hypothetical protein
MFEKLNDWAIKKAAHSKVKDLFKVSKKELFNRISELNDYINILEWEKEKAQDNAKSLSEQVKRLGNSKAIREEISTTEKEL